jgi:hypothetical protein
MVSTKVAAGASGAILTGMTTAGNGRDNPA